MVYALDTNIVINYLRNEPNVRLHFSNAIKKGDDIVIPRIVNYEIWRGFRIQHVPNKENLYRELIGQTGSATFCNIAEMDVYCWERAEDVYGTLYHKRLTVGEMDILIAALCLENNYTLITNNLKDFANIDGLAIEDWTI